MNNVQKILVVDDDLVLSDMLSEILREDGYDVMVEHDGEAGLRVALEHKPDVLVLDVMMPKMTGIAVLEQVRASEWGTSVPALLLTNVNEPETLTAVIEKGKGNVQFLLKTDWTIEQIVEKVKAALASAASA